MLKGELIPVEAGQPKSFDFEKAFEFQDKYFSLNDSLQQELKYKEIAEILDTTISSVESLIFRAKKNLRKKNYSEAFCFMCQSGYFCLLGSFVSENPYVDFASMEWHTNVYMWSILSPTCIIGSI